MAASPAPAGGKRARVMVKHGLVIGMSMAALLAVGCARQPATMTTSSVPAPTGAAVSGTDPDLASASEVVRNAADARAAGRSDRADRPAPSEFTESRELADIHFDFDRYDIRAEHATILDANATWLKANATSRLLIEGHCDARGTNEYNVALGDRRAKATMNYLVSHGVASTRISVISYGEERPSCATQDEACWAKNRRAHFLLKRG
jgi:peptidoglycan-associated lipoprotein